MSLSFTRSSSSSNGPANECVSFKPLSSMSLRVRID